MMRVCLMLGRHRVLLRELMERGEVGETWNRSCEMKQTVGYGGKNGFLNDLSYLIVLLVDQTENPILRRQFPVWLLHLTSNLSLVMYFVVNSHPRMRLSTNSSS